MLLNACEKQTVDSKTTSFLNSTIQSKPIDAVVVEENRAEAPILFSFNGLYGYVNKQFQVIIWPIYDKAAHFSEHGYVAVRCEIGDGLWEGRILDYTGNILFYENTSGITLLYEDVICYRSPDNLYTILRFKSNIILAERLGSIVAPAEDGIILVRFFDSSTPEFTHLGYAYINSSGKRILPHLKIQRISRSFREQRATITDENGDMHIIDLEGKFLGRHIYKRLGDRFSEGLLPAQTHDGHTGYVNRDGEFAFMIPLISENDDYYLAPLMAREFREGYAFIQTSKIPSAWRIINNQGQYVSDELSLSTAYPFEEGLSCVKTNEGMYGYVNVNGKIVIEPVFEEADSFHEGYARIIYRGNDGLLNTEGQVFWSNEIINDATR